MTNPSTSFLIALRQSLISQIPTVRASRDRELARETVLRIRQLTGMLELRGSC